MKYLSFLLFRNKTEKFLWFQNKNIDLRLILFCNDVAHLLSIGKSAMLVGCGHKDKIKYK